ncbi:MAG: aminotransferase class I/II-fold pyridoxal phosphate-dependent enzyme [Thermoguttaceae bacterium]|nr:aminotransferase class I/II-fold pyridoxal phosphate-dependent enzyme [Thermoguttaceae bacterium]
MQALWRESARTFFADQRAFDKSLVSYDAPQGDPYFLNAFAMLFRDRFNLPIDSQNVAVVSGAQLGAFCLLNLLAGRTSDGRRRKILIPASPEYVGYADMGVEPDIFVACPAKITYPDPNDLRTFKYAVDFDMVERVVRNEEVAAILVSRPTNPSGNVLTREELAKLEELAEKIDAWLIIDNAYGGPFPGIIEDASEMNSVFWSKRTILSYSLSKIGLPGLRTGMLVASSEIIKRVSAITAIVGLANGSLGQRIARPFFESGKILDASREIVYPYYHKRRAEAVACLRDSLSRAGVEAKIHKSEGAFFLWMWIPALKSGSTTLYQQLKERGVLAIPGDNFFYGLDRLQLADMDPAFNASRSQMMRISFSAPEQIMERGFRIIAETAAELLDMETSKRQLKQDR